MTFYRGLSSKTALGIGQIELTRQWLEDKGIAHTTLEKIEGESVVHVDVEGDVYLSDFHINDVVAIPDYIKFRDVSGCFILEKIPPQRIEPRPIEGKGDSKMQLNVGKVNLTRKWLNRYRIENTYLERNTNNETPAFFVDVDEDVVLWDMHINDVANMPEDFKFRHINGKVILGNGNRKHFHKHLRLKTLFAMAEEDLKKRNLASADLRARRLKDSLVVDIKGNLVMKDYDFKINEVPLELHNVEGEITILNRLSINEIYERLKIHAGKMIVKYDSKNADIKSELSGLLGEINDELPDDRFFGFFQEPSSDFNSVSIQSVERLAWEIIELSTRYGLPQKDDCGVNIGDYLDILKR